MKDRNQIEDLLRKFAAGNLSPRETKDFLEIINAGDDNEELKQIMTSVWDDVADSDMDVPSVKILEQLKEKIQSKEPERFSIKAERKKIQWLVFLKYAAVVILTFGITWFIKDKSIREPKPIAWSQTARAAFSEISVAYGSKSKVVLPDGSVVSLNSGSKLRYPVHFDSKHRDVFIEGEAFFEVTKDPQNPFYVKTKGITVRVLGTTFNVKAYPDEKRVETTLVTGVVELYSNRQEIKEKNRLLVLKPNQQAAFEMNKESGDSIVSMACNKIADVSTIIAWKDNKLIFRDERFDDIAQKLERWYNVEIEITDQRLKSTTLSGVFVKETIEQSLTALRLATPFEYKMEMNRIIISK